MSRDHRKSWSLLCGTSTENSGHLGSVGVSWEAANVLVWSDVAFQMELSN